MKDKNTMILGNTKVRILQYLEYKGISKPQFYTDIDIKRGLLDSDKMNATVTDTVIAKILVVHEDIDPLWLLTGEGSMLRDSKTSEESKLGCTPIATPISPAEESIIYKMYKEKDSEVGALKEEIGALKFRIRQLESQDKEPESDSPPSVVIEEIREVLGSPRTAKHANTKPHSSTFEPSARSVQPHQENQ